MLTGNISEKELQSLISEYMKRYFTVENEVWSCDHKHRIDIVMVHKSDILSSFPIGVEIKTDDKKSGSPLGKWMKQAMTYSGKEFVNFGKLMVITYPQISGKCLEEGELMSKHRIYEPGLIGHHHNVNTLLGQFNIGELQRYRYVGHEYLRIVFNALSIWDNKDDEFKTNNYLKVCPK